MDFALILGSEMDPKSLPKPSRKRDRKLDEKVVIFETCADIEREARCCIRYCVHVDLLCLYFGLRQCPREQERVRREPQ